MRNPAGPVPPLVTEAVRVAEAFRAAAMSRFEAWCRKQPPGRADSFRRTDRPDQFASPVLAGKDAAGQRLAGHDHAYYLPTAEGDDPRRLIHVTVVARDGLDVGEWSAVPGRRTWHLGDLHLRAQLVGLGAPADFRAALFGGPAGASAVWASATPYIGPAHVGHRGRARYLRKALHRELRRWLAARAAGVAIVAVEAEPSTALGRPGAIQASTFHHWRSRAGGEDFRRPFGQFRLTLSAPVVGPLSLDYANHYG